MHPYRRPQQGQGSTPRRSRADPSVRGQGQGLASRASTTNPPATPSRTSAHRPYGLPTTSSGVPIPSVPFPPLPAPPAGLSSIRPPPQITPIDRAYNQHHPNRPMAVSPAYSEPSPPAQPVPSSSNLFTPRRPPIPPWPQNHPSAAVPMSPPHGGPGYFSNAHHFEIPHLNINHHNQYATPLKDVFDLLRPYICYGAAHNSDERTNAPACHEHTRVAVQGDVVGWMRHDDGEAQKIMWLSGPAGCGKTAIAGSVAETCQGEGLLAASFFFSLVSGSEDRYSKRRVITTIASHLAEHPALSDYKEQLLLSIERHPSIFHKRLKEQAERLILDPLRSIRNQSGEMSDWPKSIILDGLDEVVSEPRPRDPKQPEVVVYDDDQLEILEVFLILIQSPAFPFRVLVASRPERNIENFFARPSVEKSTTKRFLDSKYNPDADIKLYLTAKFAEIRRRAWIGDVWPGEAILDRLVEMSSGQFIVPTTIIRWVQSGLPREQLKVVLQLQGAVGSKNPFANLDALYSHIIRRSYNPEEDPLLVVKWITTIFSDSEKRLSAVFWRQFLEDEEGELNYRMSPIASLVSVPPPNDKEPFVTLYHKSLIDFLSTEARCRDLFVNKQVSNTFVAHRILAVLQNKGPRAYSLLRDDDLEIFLLNFVEIRLVLDDGPINAPFLFYLSSDPGSRAILASCNVGRWTSAILGRYNVNPTLHLLAIFRNIHSVMQCQDNAPSHRDTSDKRASQCHAACVHWRTGILAKAKELGFCVHRLEGMAVDELTGDRELFRRLLVDWIFTPVYSGFRCIVCFPKPN